METPYIVIDESVLRNNINKMTEMVHQNSGVALRPHIKTHKTPKIAQIQIDAGAVGITVATISEAEVMAANGIEDIFIAYPIVDREKAKQVCILSKKIKRLIVGVDSLFGLKVLQEIAEMEDVVLNVRVEIDTGLKRTGISMEESVEFVESLQKMDHIYFDGIYTFRGAVLKGESTLDLRAAGIEEGNLMVDLANTLREAGIEVNAVSVGSTPTALSAATVEGVTEVRPGTYVFNDAMQVKFGVCAWEDCAASVVTTAVSKHGDRVVIDGGSKTFATDVQPNQVPLLLKGFGEIVGHNNAVFNRMNEEHGVIEENVDDIEIGDHVKIIPNHICSTVNLHDNIYFKKADGTLQQVKVEARGKLQ